MTTTAAIKALKAKGYIVNAYDNMEFGIINKDCPVVYEILNPDYSHVYGANAVGPENICNWVDILCDVTTTSERPNQTAFSKADGKKEREFDLVYNEGAEGYNPYRQ